MKKYYFILFLLFFIWQNAESHNATPPKPYIIATTTMIKSIVVNVANNDINIEVLSPAGMCPGHFDIKPHHLKMIENSAVVFYHGWEPWIESIKLKVKKRDNKFIKIETNGSIKIPNNYITATKKVVDNLIDLMPNKKNFYLKSSNEYIDRIKKEAKEIKEKAKPLKSVPVICAKQQEEFLRWLGLDVKSSYDTAEELNPKKILLLVDEVRKYNIKAVVDNLQSGTRIGQVISKETGIKHIVLSNFPIDGSYIQLLDDSIEELLGIQ